MPKVRYLNTHVFNMHTHITSPNTHLRQSLGAPWDYKSEGGDSLLIGLAP